jgi:hypothetical protein
MKLKYKQQKGSNYKFFENEREKKKKTKTH